MYKSKRLNRKNFFYFQVYKLMFLKIILLLLSLWCFRFVPKTIQFTKLPICTINKVTCMYYFAPLFLEEVSVKTKHLKGGWQIWVGQQCMSYINYILLWGAYCIMRLIQPLVPCSCSLWNCSYLHHSLGKLKAESNWFFDVSAFKALTL